MRKPGFKKLSVKTIVIVIALIFSALNYLFNNYHYANNDKGIPDPLLSVYDDGALSVHHIDVEQGDATLIRTPGGKYMLIDTGTYAQSHKLCDYLENMGVTEIEYCIFTHPHEDHIGCADIVLENFKVNNVLMTRKSTTTATFERLIDAIAQSKEKHGTKLLSPAIGDKFSLDENVSFTILYSDDKDDNLNNCSVCLKLDYKDTSFIFTGDAEAKVERLILKNFGESLESTVFKSAHHGSSTSNTKSFVDAINPQISIISCGLDNSYGHPHKEVLEDLLSRECDIYRTDIDGDIVVVTDGEKVNCITSGKINSASTLDIAA